MLKGKYSSLYKKRGEDGLVRTVFRYLLSGPKAMLERYEKVLTDQGVPVHKDEKSGQIIYFTTVCHADIIDLDITDNDRIVVVNDTVEKLESKLQLVQDPTLKQAMANRIAEMILGSAVTPAPQQAVAEATPATESASEEETDM